MNKNSDNEINAFFLQRNADKIKFDLTCHDFVQDLYHLIIIEQTEKIKLVTTDKNFLVFFLESLNDVDMRWDILLQQVTLKKTS